MIDDNLENDFDESLFNNIPEELQLEDVETVVEEHPADKNESQTVHSEIEAPILDIPISETAINKFQQQMLIELVYLKHLKNPKAILSCPNRPIFLEMEELNCM